MALTKYLKRYTNSTEFIPEIDGIRFFSIITVMLFHLNSTLSQFFGNVHIEDSYELMGGGANPLEAGWWFRRLDLGVKVFFAVSGFVLALPFLKSFISNQKPVSLTGYYLRRISRIEPPFLISIIIFFVGYMAFGSHYIGDALKSLLATVCYSHVLIYGIPSPINPVTWSLETEAQFYLLFPFIFMFIFAYRSQAWIWFSFFLTIIGSLFVRNLFFFEDNQNFSLSVFFYISYFAVGVLIAWIYISAPWFFVRKSYLFDLIMLFSTCCLFLFYKPQDNWIQNTFFNASLILFFFSIFKGRMTNFIATRPAIYLIGGMCYSIYLLHLGLFHLLMRFAAPMITEFSYTTSLMTVSIILIPITLVVCGLFYVLVERTTMQANWFKKLILSLKLDKD